MSSENPEAVKPSSKWRHSSDWTSQVRRQLKLGPPQLGRRNSTPVTTGEKETLEAARIQSARDKFSSMKSELDQQLAPLTGAMPTFTLPQNELRTRVDTYDKDIDSASADQAEKMVRSIEEQLDKVRALRIDEDQKLQMKSQHATLNKSNIDLFRVTAGAPPWLNGPEQELLKADLAFRSKVQKGTSTECDTLLKQIQAKLPEVREAREKYAEVEKYNNVIKPQMEKVLAIKLDVSKELTDAQGELREADREFHDKIDAATVPEAKSLTKDLNAALKEALKASAARVEALVGDTTLKKSEVRKKITEYAGEDPGILKTLAEDKAGRDLLDGLVEDLGDKASSKTDKQFVKSAIEAKYGLELKGDLTTKVLPRLYNVLNMVPDSHTRGNDSLKELKRNKNYTPYSFYASDGNDEENVGEKSIVLNGIRTGGLQGWAVDVIVGNHPVTKYRDVKGDKSMNGFNATTLHEIGHAVDDKEGFMQRSGSSKKFGGWLEHGIQEVADVAGNAKGFYSDFGKDLPHTFLQGYLMAALKKGFDPGKFKSIGEDAVGCTAPELENDPGVKAAINAVRDLDRAGDEWKKKDVEKARKESKKAIALTGGKKSIAEKVIDGVLNKRSAKDVIGDLLSMAPPPQAKVNWKDLAKHEAVKWCQAVKLSGSDSGLWEKGDKAKEFAIDGRVYHEAYSDDWFSYDASQLSTRVTNYQFRAPGEWFADAYSVYYMGKMHDHHPLKSWLDSQTPPKK